MIRFILNVIQGIGQQTSKNITFLFINCIELPMNIIMKTVFCNLIWFLWGCVYYLSLLNDTDRAQKMINTIFSIYRTFYELLLKTDKQTLQQLDVNLLMENRINDSSKKTCDHIPFWTRKYIEYNRWLVYLSFLPTIRIFLFIWYFARTVSYLDVIKEIEHSCSHTWNLCKWELVSV